MTISFLNASSGLPSYLISTQSTVESRPTIRVEKDVHLSIRVKSRHLFGAAAASVFAGIFAIGLNGLLNGNQKAILVFWRLTHPLPGSRAFSQFLETDVRIDPQVIRSRHGPLPEDPADQNRLWFHIYRQHRTEPSVEDAHQGYLLTRDLAALSLFFVISLVPIVFVIGPPSYYPLYYAAALLCAYIFFSHAARNYGESLVTNVLAIESSS